MSALNSAVSSPQKDLGELPSNKFKKLLSNKLQAKIFNKTDLYNNFKTPSRNSFLEQYHKMRTKSNIPTIQTDDIQTQNTINTNISYTPSQNPYTSPSSSKGFEQNAKISFLEDNQSNQSKPHFYHRLNFSQGRNKQSTGTPSTPNTNIGKTYQQFETPYYSSMKSPISTTAKSKIISSTPNLSPRNKMEIKINSAKIPSGLFTETTLNQLQQSNQANQLQNSFFQVQYLSRTKDKKFLEMIDKSKHHNAAIINSLDIPSFQDYTSFMQRQNALNSLLQEFTKSDFTKQIHSSNDNTEAYNPNYFYSVKGNLVKKMNQPIQYRDLQGRVDKSMLIKQVDCKKMAVDEVDQNLFESYLDCLKNNYTLSVNAQNSQNSKIISIKNNQFNSITSLPQHPQNIDSSMASSLHKEQITQNRQPLKKQSSERNFLNKSSTLFNPNAFAQEHYLSLSKKKSILQKSGEREKSRKSFLANGLNDNTDQIVENYSNDQQNTRFNRDQTEKIQQQIKNNTFSVVNSPKATKYEDAKIIITRTQQQTPQKQHQEEQKQENNVQICDLNDGLENEHKEEQEYLSSYQKQGRHQKMINLGKQQEIAKFKIEEIESSILKIIEYIDELKILYNSTIQFTNIIVKIPGFNDLIRSFILKEGVFNELQSHITLINSKKAILNYLYSKLQFNRPIAYNQKHPQHEDDIQEANHVNIFSIYLKPYNFNVQIIQKLDLLLQEIPIENLEEIAKQIVYFSRSIYSHVQVKREGHQKKQVDEVKIQIQNISQKTKQQFNNLINQVPSKTQSLVKLQNMQNNLTHIIDRKKYIKQQPFIEKFENKEEQLGQFKKVSEVSRNKSKQLNELNDIIRDFDKYS